MPAAGEAMDTSSFFQYPTELSTEARTGMVFMEGCKDEEWSKLLAYTETRRFQAGEVIVHEGDRDDAIYFIQSGELEVLVPHARSKKLRRLATISVGSVIGEQAFLDGQPRSATIRAVTAGEMYRLNRESFTVLSAKDPTLAHRILLDLGRILSLRLREVTHFIASGMG